MSSLQAQTPPAPADEFLRQQERERLLREQQERGRETQRSSPETPPSNDQIPLQEAQCIPIQQLTLVGDATKLFEWALHAANTRADGTPDPATPHCLGNQGVNVVMRRMQNELIAQGFSVSQILLGPQTQLENGVLELTLLPGRVRHIEQSNTRASNAYLQNAMPLTEGDIINLRDLEQTLENFNRLPSVESNIELRAAEGPDAEPGQSDLVVHWKQSRPFRANFSFDDAGSKTTGKYQGGLTLSYDHLLGLNDLFYVSLNHDTGKSGNDLGPYGTRGHTIHYSVPVGYWLWGLTQSSNQYQQTIAGANQTYRYRGKSQNSEIKLSRVMYRNAQHKSTASLTAWTRHSRNHIEDTEIGVQHRRMAGWDLAWAHRTFVGANIINANLVYRRGTGAWNALPAAEENTGEGTARPQIMTADIQLDTPLTLGKQAFRYTGTWRGQYLCTGQKIDKALKTQETV